MTTALQMRLDKSHNLFWMRLAQFDNLIMPKTDLGIESGVRLLYKLTKSLIETSNKMHKPKTYNEAINNLIYESR